MPSKWGIRFWPECDRHVFLSHSAEDRDQLVVPVFEEIERRELIPFIDRHHYPAGRDAFQVLREELLRSRHVVYFLTPAALRQGRGWMTVERVFAELIQRQFSYGDEVVHVELPLLLVPPSDPVFQRSSWRVLIDKASEVSPDLHVSDVPTNWTGDHVMWCADTIERFVAREERWAIEVGERLEQDTKMKQHFRGEPKRMRRMLAQTPRRVEIH